MKKKNLKSLKLNKKTISILEKEVYGGAAPTTSKKINNSDTMSCHSIPPVCTHTCPMQ